MKTDIKSLNKQELKKFITEAGFPGFRADQLYDWMHKKLVLSLDEMSNVPKDLKAFIQNETELVTLQHVTHLESKDGSTAKFLFRLPDGHVIESVRMVYKHGISVCISSQVGCRMGCRFCASTLGGLVRSLAPSEMLEQIYRIQQMTGERVSNIVVMGTGEPLDNFDNLIKFIELITDENGLNISQRNITVSTCGIVPNIKRLADLDLSITLAISLHASNDEERKKIMPVANKYSIAEIMEATDYYFKVTGRRLTFEYSLIAGENDDLKSAEGLTRLLAGKGAHINLIPVNPIKERDYKQSGEGHIVRFKNILEKSGINVTIRREMGADIDAACGQLRKDYMDGNVTIKEEESKG